MTTRLAIYIPTYRRPHVLEDVFKNINTATDSPCRVYFGVEPDDKESFKAAFATGARVVVNRYEQGYSNTIQSIHEAAVEPFFLHANDDFLFLPNWDETPLSMFERKDLMVVGLRQTEGDTHGSAISMVRRRYIEEMSGVIDMPRRVFYPYNHNYVDTEFTRTAQARGVWAKCEPLVIVHQHPGFTGKEKDETHKKNDATAELDKQTFESRKHLWEELS